MKKHLNPPSYTVQKISMVSPQAPLDTLKLLSQTYQNFGREQGYRSGE